MESQQSLNIVLRIPDSEIYLVQNEEVNSLVKGTMNLVELPTFDSYIISIEDFGYHLSKEIPVMTKKLPSGESIYILPNIEGYFGLKFPAETDSQLISVFETILKNSGEFIIEAEQPLIGEAKKVVSEPTATTEGKDQEMVPEQEEEDSDLLIKSGEFIREGLIKVATFAAGGISKAGSFLIQKFVSKSEDVEVKESTKKRIRYAKSTTTSIAVFTATQIKNVVTVAGTIAMKIGKSLENSDKGQEMKQKPSYNAVLNIGRSTVQAAATVYDGMKEASGVITRELAKTTTEAVTHRYGLQAGEATSEVFEIVENVGNVYSSIPTGIVKALASKEKMIVAAN